MRESNGIQFVRPRIRSSLPNALAFTCGPAKWGCQVQRLVRPLFRSATLSKETPQAYRRRIPV